MRLVTQLQWQANISLVLQLTIVFYVGGHVIVDDMLDGGEVQALGGHICCNKDVLSPFTELSDRPLTLLLVYGVRERVSFLKIWWARSSHTVYIPRPPWMLTASTPFSNRYSWISSTSAFFSENTNTYIISSGGDGNTGVPRLQIFNEYSQMHKQLTGGGVFCRHSRR